MFIPLSSSFLVPILILLQNRDKQIKAVLKKYSITVPFEPSSQLTSKAVNGILHGSICCSSADIVIEMIVVLNAQLDELRASIQSLKAEIKTSNDSFQENIDKATQEKLQGEERSLQSRRTKVSTHPSTLSLRVLIVCYTYRKKILARSKV